MNDNMLTVSNSEFGKLDILVENGVEYFPASDCAKLLGYSNPYGAITKHCKSCSKRAVDDAAGKKQEINFITEGDLYRLIVRSRLPSAEKFEKWLFEEVLPSIRRTGGYRISLVHDMPHAWRGMGAILAEDAAKLLGVTRGKVRDTLKSRPTVYVRGIDYEALEGNELGEYKFYNRVRSPGKKMTVIFESGLRKLQWELCGVGTPDVGAMIAPASAQLPMAIQQKNDRMQHCLNQIAKAIAEMNE